jgi:hypothetical protein
VPPPPDVTPERTAVHPESVASDTLELLIMMQASRRFPTTMDPGAVATIPVVPAAATTVEA